MQKRKITSMSNWDEHNSNTHHIVNGPIMPVDTHYYFPNDIEVATAFASQHGKFMLSKAVMLLQTKSWLEGVNDAIARGQKVNSESLTERDYCVKAMKIAKQQWWFNEADWLVDNHLYDVLNYAEVIRDEHKSCGPTRPCSHKNWYATGSPTQRLRERHSAKK